MSARKTLTQKLKKIHLPTPFKNRSSAGTENGREVIGNYEEQDGVMENPSATVSILSRVMREPAVLHMRKQ